VAGGPNLDINSQNSKILSKYLIVVFQRQQIKKKQQTNKKNFMARIVEINAVSVWFFCVSFSEILNSITTTESIF
jgi:hypothetical protein